jgi:hypothetical protein
VSDYEHMVIHKARERELIESAERARYLQVSGRMSRRRGEAPQSRVIRLRSVIAKTLRTLADAIDSYRAGCVDGQLTCD